MIGKAMRMLSLKTIYFNFRYLPFRQAIKLPVWVSRHCRIRKAAGSVRITAPIRMGMIRIGYDGVGIFDNRRSRSIWKNSGEVIFRGRASLGHGARISVEKEGRLIFGDHFTLTAESAIACAKNISFGDGCLLSWDILIMDTDWHRLKEGDRVTNPPAAVVIGNHVWDRLQDDPFERDVGSRRMHDRRGECVARNAYRRVALARGRRAGQSDKNRCRLGGIGHEKEQ